MCSFVLMENMLTYIVLIAIGGLVYGAYLIKNASTKPLLLSKQIYPEIIMKVLVVKQKNKLSSLQLEVFAREYFSTHAVVCELIMTDRQYHSLPMNSAFSMDNKPVPVPINQHMTWSVPFENFKEAMLNEKLPFRTFRIVLVSENGKKYKSNELAFNKKWTIYKPDSGSYN